MASLIYDTTFPPEPAPAPVPAARPLPSGLDPAIVKPILPCSKCDGKGHSLSKGFTCEDGRRFPSEWRTCYSCDGKGWFHAPDIFALVQSVKGRKPGRLRSKRPDDARGYYVWRLARFHGGADVCLPMGAEMEVSGDPYKAILDQLAKIVAKSVYGSGDVGSARWQQAMYGNHDYDDLPQHIDGPVYDADKPVEEFLETI